MDNANNQNSPSQSSSRRFIKGVHRASFSPVAEDIPGIVVTPPSYQPPPSADPIQPAPAAPVAAAPPPVSQPVQAAPVSVTPKTTKPKRKGSVARTIFFILLGFVVAGASGYSFYMYWVSQQQLSKLQAASPQTIADMQSQDLVTKVGRHMLLPDEIPLIQTVTDVASFKNQPFFAHAKDGDKVLVFSQRAILYDPVADKIIEVGAVRPVTPTPVAQAPEQASGSGVPAVAGVSTIAAPTPKILIQNDK